MSNAILPTGIYSTLITPFDANGRVNLAALADQINYLAALPIDGIFPCGSTGEFMNLSFEENVKILETVAAENKNRKTLVCGACATNKIQVIEYLKEASALGYAAAVVCPPYYVKMNDTEILSYYRSIADNPYNMSILLYNVPLFTTGLPLAVIKTLMGVDNIVGIKDSSANLKQIIHTVDLRGDTAFRVFCGTDDIMLPALAAGCDGIMTALSCVLPEPILKIRELFEKSDFASASKLQRSILAVIRLADSLPFPLGYKLISSCRGLPIGSWYQNVSGEIIETIKNSINGELESLLGEALVIYR